MKPNFVLHLINRGFYIIWPGIVKWINIIYQKYTPTFQMTSSCFIVVSGCFGGYFKLSITLPNNSLGEKDQKHFYDL